MPEKDQKWQQRKTCVVINSHKKLVKYVTAQNT